jgi:hypothetical protein
MNFYWIYEIPLLFAFILITGFSILYSMGGLWIARKTFHNKLKYSHDRNEQVSFFMTSIGVFYGITLGLVAIGTWETFDQVQQRVSEESATLGALYRDANCFPEPKRTQLQSILKDYTRQVIDEDWPLQQKGIVPLNGVATLTDFHNTLTTFEPSSKREEVLFTATLRMYDEFITMRRLRLMSVNNGLPDIIWMITISGALASISFFWFFIMENKIIQNLLTIMVSFFIGVMIFMIAMMDNPYRGKVSVSSESFKLIYEQLIQDKE